MRQHTLVIVLLLQVAVAVVATVVVLALRRWQRSIWLREEGKTAQGFEVKVRGEEQA